MGKKKGVSKKEAARVQEVEVQNPLVEDIEERMRGALDDVEDLTPQDVREVGLNPDDYEFKAATEGEPEAPEESAEPVAEEPVGEPAPVGEPVPPEAPPAVPEPDIPGLQAQIQELKDAAAKSKGEFSGLLGDKQAAIDRAQAAEYQLQLATQRAATPPVAPQPAMQFPADDDLITGAQLREIVAAQRADFAQNQAVRDRQQFAAQHPDFAQDVQAHLVPFANARADRQGFLQALQQLPTAYAYEHIQQIKRANLAEARVRELEGGNPAAAQTATPQPSAAPAAPPAAPPIIPAASGGLGRAQQLTAPHAIADLTKRVSLDALTPEDEELLRHSEQVDPMSI